jgi:hypothetical protein
MCIHIVEIRTLREKLVEIISRITQAKTNEGGFWLLVFSMFVTSVTAGYYMQSWFWFGGVYLGLIICYQVPQLRDYIHITVIYGWAALGYTVGNAFFCDNAGYVLAVLGGIVGLSASMQVDEFLDE